MTPSFDDVKKGERLMGYFALCFYFGIVVDLLCILFWTCSVDMYYVLCHV